MILMQVAVLILLAALSIGLAAVEAAFYLVKRRRLSHVAVHNPRAEIVNRYLDDPPTLLMPVHMGTYTAHVAMTVVITSLFLGLVSEWALLIAFLSMAVYLLLFRLSVPYTLVRRNPERSLLLLLPVFHAYCASARSRPRRSGTSPCGAPRTRSPWRCRRRPCTTRTRGAWWTRSRGSPSPRCAT